MVWVDFYTGGGALLQLTSFGRQYAFNRTKKSIYGLSYDYIALSWLGYIANIASCIAYTTSSQVQLQYELRNPVYPNGLVVSWPVYAIDTTNLGVLTLLIVQLAKYRNTMNTNQGISPVVKVVVIVNFLVFVKVVKDAVYHHNTINLLDVVDFVWLMAKFYKAIALMSQVTMNWFDDCISGTFDGFLVVENLKLLLLVLAKICNHYYQEYPWYANPVNFDTWPSLLANMLVLAVFNFQAYIYRGAKPSLPRKYREEAV